MAGFEESDGLTCDEREGREGKGKERGSATASGSDRWRHEGAYNSSGHHSPQRTAESMMQEKSSYRGFAPKE
jgi:hypothetical protein